MTIKPLVGQLVCPVCLNPHGNCVLLPVREISPTTEKDPIVGYSENPCGDCKELLKKGVVVIEIDASKTTDQTNPYRTGRLFVVRNEAFPDEIHNKPIFMDKEVLKDVNE